MRELNVNEIKEVSGGIAPALIWFAGSSAISWASASIFNKAY